MLVKSVTYIMRQLFIINICIQIKLSIHQNLIQFHFTRKIILTFYTRCI